MTTTACERKTIQLLLVEDNLGDQRLTMEVLKDSKVCNKMHTACDFDFTLYIDAMQCLHHPHPQA